MSAPQLLLLDHEDSFSFLLGDQFAARGADVTTLRARLPLEELQQRIEAAPPLLVVLSPGPGRPEDAGVTLQWLATRPRVPIFGVCLGLQAIAQAAGADITPAPRPRHGVATTIDVRDVEPFRRLPRRQQVGRYHSLVASALPPTLDVLATAREPEGGDGRELVMALAHRELPQLAVQFHPESLLTPHGGAWIDAVLAWAATARTGATR